LVTRDGTRALKGITFDVGKGKKVGVIGRTGSGKSTLLSSLLKLIEVTEGTITIDGVDISKVPKSIVRNRLICIPQDPLLLPGTIRFNLDPEQHFSASDAPLSEALRLVNMQALVDARGGLDAELQASSLSHGERQLLALARAILRRRQGRGRCVLVLDEATSNLDDATERVVEKVIAEEFRGVTIISVAHRLQTVRDADAVVVLEKGEVAKIGPFSEVA
jgi:ATP-binding cassette, subfamily C (CFTR/MRP), member 1